MSEKFDRSIYNNVKYNSEREVDMHREEKRNRERWLVSEERKEGFKCGNCKQWVPFSEFMGTEHRNHCPLCLWSKHVDLNKPGDRKAECQAGMKPIGLTFKQEGVNKYGKPKQGELMTIHQCAGCGKVSINRIASDDNPETILKVFEESRGLTAEEVERLREEGVEPLTEKNKDEILTQLFGKNELITISLIKSAVSWSP